MAKDVENLNDVRAFMEQFVGNNKKTNEWLMGRGIRDVSRSKGDTHIIAKEFSTKDNIKTRKFYFKATESLSMYIKMCIDFLAVIDSNDSDFNRLFPEAKKISSHLEKYSITDIGKKSQKWYEHLNASGNPEKAAKEEGEYLSWDNGLKIVHLNGAEALKMEGKRMNHCVAGKAYLLETFPGTEFYSLRSPDNEPLATLFIQRNPQSDEPNTIFECKGHTNKKVEEAYISYLQEFLSSLDKKDRNDDPVLCKICLDSERFGLTEEERILRTTKKYQSGWASVLQNMNTKPLFSIEEKISLKWSGSR